MFLQNVADKIAHAGTRLDREREFDRAKAPWVVGAAATDDDAKVTSFSSRGRKPSYNGVTNYDRREVLANTRDHYENGGGSVPSGSTATASARTATAS